MSVEQSGTVRWLVSCFEQIMADRSGTVVTVAVTADKPAPRATVLAEFYHSLAGHRSFSGGWRAALAPGQLGGSLEKRLLPFPPQFCWLGLVASDQPGLEEAQLEAQLRAFGRDGQVDGWLRDATFGELSATISLHPVDCTGDEADQAFAMLGEPVGQRPAAIAAAARALDAVIEQGPLLGAGGVLGVDGPRPHARALMTAALLQRLAARYPVVLAVDDAHRPGPFVEALVASLSATRSPVLIVLAGAPVETSHSTLAGPLGERAETTTTVARSQSPIEPLPPSDTAVAVATVLGAALPTDVFLLSHMTIAAGIASVDADSAETLLDELVGAGWVRCLVPGVFTFTDDSFRNLSDRHLSSVESTELLDSARQALGRGRTADPLVDTLILPSLIALQAEQAAFPHEASIAGKLARLLARCGYLQQAIDVAGELLRTPVERAAIVAWKASLGQQVTAELDEVTKMAVGAASEGGNVETLLIAAALHRHDPRRSAELRSLAIEVLGPCGEDPPPAEARLRLAAARLALTAGSVADMARALGPTQFRWLSSSAAKTLADLKGWAELPGLLARSSDVLSGLQLIDTLRNVAPRSEAMGRALLHRLATLDLFGRIETVGDAAELADAAAGIFRSPVTGSPELAARAQSWRAWCSCVRGDIDGGHATIDALLVSISADLPPEHRIVLDARLWHGRILLADGQPQAALVELDDALGHYGDGDGDGDGSSTFDLGAARLWRVDCLAALGRHAEAATDADRLTDELLAHLPPDHENVLLARHRRGAALTNLGNPGDAIEDLDFVVATRRLLDLPDAPRQLAAQHSRAVCLLRLGRHDEALHDLDQVVTCRDAALAALDERRVNAHADRGVALLMLGRWSEALDDLDQALADRLTTRADDDLSVLSVRQQRILCLNALGRADAAQTELHLLAAAAGAMPDDHPFQAVVRQLSEQLGGLSADVG
jgi:tetratricopeptide (TPR) repeat protein